MKQKTKNKLYQAWAWCDYRDRSTEFMLQFMGDFAGVSYDTAASFVVKSTESQRSKWYKDNPNWYDDFTTTINDRLKQKQ